MSIASPVIRGRVVERRFEPEAYANLYETPRDYGVTARILVDDRTFRAGSKVWVAEQPNAQSDDVFIVLGTGRHGLAVKHWISADNLHLFVPCTVPAQVRGHVTLPRSTLVEARETAARLEAHADALRLGGTRLPPDEEIEGPEEGFIHQEEDL